MNVAMKPPSAPRMGEYKKPSDESNPLIKTAAMGYSPFHSETDNDNAAQVYGAPTPGVGGVGHVAAHATTGGSGNSDGCCDCCTGSGCSECYCDCGDCVVS